MRHEEHDVQQRDTHAARSDGAAKNTNQTKVLLTLRLSLKDASGTQCVQPELQTLPPLRMGLSNAQDDKVWPTRTSRGDIDEKADGTRGKRSRKLLYAIERLPGIRRGDIIRLDEHVHRPMVFLRPGYASTSENGLASSRAYVNQKITPRASRQHLLEPPSPPTHGSRCCPCCQLSLLTYCSQLSFRGSESGTPCLTRWAVHDHSFPLFAATRRSRIGQLRPPSMAQRLPSPVARTRPIMQFRNILFIIEI